MAIQLQLRRGTTAQNNVFVGAIGELVMNTDTHGLSIHDGQVAGGYHVPVIVGAQRPSESNGRTWYVRYSNGRVEQGGYSNTPAQESGIQQRYSITLPVPITSADPYIGITPQYISKNTAVIVSASSASTVINVSVQSTDGTTLPNTAIRWYVTGWTA